MAWVELEQEQEGRRRQNWMNDYRIVKHAKPEDFKLYYDSIVKGED